MCWVPALTVCYSCSSQWWIGLLFFLDEGSYVRATSVDVHSTFTGEKKNVFLKTTARGCGKLAVKEPNVVLERGRKHDCFTAWKVPENSTSRELIKLNELEAGETADGQPKSRHAALLTSDHVFTQSSVMETKAEGRFELPRESFEATETEQAYKGVCTGRKLQALVVLNAAWGEWASWSKCSAECGPGGFSVRRRNCETVPDIPCEGMSFDVRPCNFGIRCEAKFSDWGVWGPCSVTCGEGVRARSRVCVAEDKEVKCRGLSSLLERCKMPKCEPPKPVTAAPAGYAMNPNAAAGINVVPIPMSYYYVLHHPGDTTAQFNTAPPSPWSPYEPTSFVKVKVPLPPLIATAKYKGHPGFIWGAWGHWSLCSSRCGEGFRLRERLCIDNSQDTPVRVTNRWCGKGLDSQTVGCMGQCKKVAPYAEEDSMPSRVRVVETGSKSGPRVITFHEPDKEMKMSRAEVIETGGKHGPDVITGNENDKSGPLSKVEVIETGDKKGPMVHTEHEPAAAHDTSELESSTLRAEPEGIEIGELTPETVLFIVLFLVCLVLLITAFCIYFYQRMQEAKALKQLQGSAPFYKQTEDDDVGGEPVNGVVKPVMKPLSLSHLQERSSREHTRGSNKKKIRKKRLKNKRKYIG